ncbi:hypothetical protein KC19_VG092500 [Ceratodon purpureus]|uniref:Uncharacterized protein n=1 Tax=Ceratodon purpureus TaxID=3225 RepID=A0A8T0HP82_CERPU|nr:hypothetical protein KC19_VG092500 [Ceratodon purpureus]
MSLSNPALAFNLVSLAWSPSPSPDRPYPHPCWPHLLTSIGHRLAPSPILCSPRSPPPTDVDFTCFFNLIFWSLHFQHCLFCVIICIFFLRSLWFSPWNYNF